MKTDDNVLIIDIEGRDLLSDFMFGMKGLYSTRLTWNDLMPVVEKIESLGFTFIIDNNEANVLSDEDPDKGLFLGTYPTKLESTYAVVVQFIKWHNSQNQ